MDERHIRPAAGTAVLTVAAKFARQTENLTTASLHHVLVQSEAARTAFNRLLAAPDDVRWTLEEILPASEDDDGQGRVDLCGRRPGAAEPAVYLEAKFDAQLTKAQPAVYLQRLPPGGQLLLLAPADRAVPLATTVRRRIDELHDWLTAGEDLRTFDAHGPDGTRTVTLRTWDDLLGQLRDAMESVDPAAHADLVQVTALARSLQSERHSPLTSTVLTGQTVPAAWRQCMRLLTLLRSRFDSHGHQTRHLSGGGPTWVGFSLQRPGAAIKWQVQVCAWLWDELAGTPFWLTIDDGDRPAHGHLIEPWTRQTPPVAFTVPSGWSHRPGPAFAVPLWVPVEADDDHVVISLANQTIAVCDEIEPQVP